GRRPPADLRRVLHRSRRHPDLVRPLSREPAAGGLRIRRQSGARPAARPGTAARNRLTRAGRWSAEERSGSPRRPAASKSRVPPIHSAPDAAATRSRRRPRRSQGSPRGVRSAQPPANRVPRTGNVDEDRPVTRKQTNPAAQTLAELEATGDRLAEWSSEHAARILI